MMMAMYWVDDVHDKDVLHWESMMVMMVTWDMAAWFRLV